MYTYILAIIVLINAHQASSSETKDLASLQIKEKNLSRKIAETWANYSRLYAKKNPDSSDLKRAHRTPPSRYRSDISTEELKALQDLNLLQEELSEILRLIHQEEAKINALQPQRQSVETTNQRMNTTTSPKDFAREFVANVLACVTIPNNLEPNKELATLFASNPAQTTASDCCPCQERHADTPFKFETAKSGNNDSVFYQPPPTLSTKPTSDDL